jgi:hypothetical protein
MRCDCGPVTGPYRVTSSLLKKPPMAFSILKNEKRGYHFAPIFHDLPPSKMTVHPCTVSSLSKIHCFDLFRPACQFNLT